MNWFSPIHAPHNGIITSRASKWGTLKSAGNPRCTVHAEMDAMQNSAPSWIAGARHLESSFACLDSLSIRPCNVHAPERSRGEVPVTVTGSLAPKACITETHIDPWSVVAEILMHRNFKKLQYMKRFLGDRKSIRDRKTRSQTIGHCSRTFSCPSLQESTGQMLKLLLQSRAFSLVGRNYPTLNIREAPIKYQPLPIKKKNKYTSTYM